MAALGANSLLPSISLTTLLLLAVALVVTMAEVAALAAISLSQTF